MPETVAFKSDVIAKSIVSGKFSSEPQIQAAYKYISDHKDDFNIEQLYIECGVGNYPI
jgi:hypothetical protein